MNSSKNQKMQRKSSLVLVSSGLIVIGGILLFLFCTTRLIESTPDTFLAYTHPVYGFSLHYPHALTVSRGQEEPGETVLFQQAEGGVVFQVFVVPFDEPGLLTAARLRQEFPSRVMDNPHEFTLKDGTPALAFVNTDPTIGRYYEVWFAHQGRVYHIATQIEFQKTLERILKETWTFE
jgi:hypothetical protein